MKTKSSQKKLREKLSGTVTGKKNTSSCKAAVFKEYIKKAFPNFKILAVIPIETKASLNSLSAYVDLVQKNGKPLSAFAKIHIESATQSHSILGAVNEYANANLLANYGWPVVSPLMVSRSKDYPLILYPKIKEETLFDLFKKSYDKGKNFITKRDLAVLFRLNRQVGKAMANSLKKVSAKKAADAPVQTLFLDRFKTGGRLDYWYKPCTRFALTGKDGDIIWEQLIMAKWIINGSPYKITLAEIIEKARKYLSFAQESKALVCISHGDDHSGNIFIDREKEKALVFDPAFAGWNPAILSNIKALAHSCFLPMSGMYYDPKIKNISYKWNKNKNTISVDLPFEKSVLYSTHEVLAKQIIDLRILPLIQASGPARVKARNEFERMKCALSGCALLTTNISNLLEERKGRGQGLLPLTIMFAELKGLPTLDYLREKTTRAFQSNL